jgi:hypothetical protein
MAVWAVEEPGEFRDTMLAAATTVLAIATGIVLLFCQAVQPG